jgi:hypothetical protein
MPYYTPPGGAMTAAYARSLMGLGVAMNTRNPTMYARPTASQLAVRAAQSSALFRRSQRAGAPAGVPLMSGMGLGILPSANVRYTKTAIPAAIARRKWMAQQRKSGVSGLGATRPRIMGVAPIMGIRHQAGYFMGPGGGPGGGPFQTPGYSMSGMGLRLGQDDDEDTSMYDDTSTLIAPTFSTPAESPYASILPGIPAVTPIDTTMINDNSSLIAPAAATAAAASSGGFVPANQPVPAGLLPGTAPSAFSQLMSAIFGPSTTTAKNAQGVPVTTPISSTITSLLPLVLIGGVGIAVISAMRKR